MNRCVHELFEEWADRTPDAPALLYDGHELTYRELDARANRLAHHLRRLGVGPESRVATCFEHSVDWVVGALAALKAGAAYVPLDPAHPSDRLAYLCEDAGVSALLLHRTLAERVPYDRAHRVHLDADAAALAREPADRPPPAAGPDHLAYVLYTSGSTGRPKGVGITHRNVVTRSRDNGFLAVRPAETVAQACSHSFDASTLEIWNALLNGARLVGIRREDQLDAERMHEMLRSAAVDVMFAPIAVVEHVVAERPDAFSSLRCLMTGADRVEVHTVRRILEAGPPRELLNLYGPTEGTILATAHRCNDLASGETSLPIGRAIARTDVHVLDEDGRPVPPGVAGELHIGGDGLARGYLGRPDLTAERFVPDHLGGRPGGRLYRTGDLARRRPNGDVEFLGRIDRQVKIRGVRIELGEIEACLHDSDRVREATVQAIPGAAGEPQLVAWVVASAPDVTADELRARLRERLPASMVPADVVLAPSLPLTANGKLDVRALAELARPAPAALVAPRTPTEEHIAGIWREVLDLPAVGVHDSFFELGGHSLTATRLASRLSASLRVDLTLRMILERQTIAELAEAIEPLRAGGGGAAAIGRDSRPRRSVEDLLDEVMGLSDDEVTALVDAGA